MTGDNFSVAIYQYECVNPFCAHEYEVVKPISEFKKLDKCPKCRNTSRVMLTPPNIIIK